MPDCNHSTDDLKPTKAGALLTALVLGPIFRPLLSDTKVPTWHHSIRLAYVSVYSSLAQIGLLYLAMQATVNRFNP